MQDPSQRQTEVYIRENDFEEHIKLRKPVDDNLTTIKTLQKGLYERNRDDTTNKPSNELIAANAATQATVSVMAAENAGIKTQLAPLLPLQSPAKQKEEQTETGTETTNKKLNEQTAKQKIDKTTSLPRWST